MTQFSGGGWMQTVRWTRALLCLLGLISLTACVTPQKRVIGPLEPVAKTEYYKASNLRAYTVQGITYQPRIPNRGDEQKGLASWYGPGFHSNRTANGEPFDMNGFSAAHKTLPLPSVVEVTNLENNRTIRVRVNDRGPFVDGRIIDLSKGAAQMLGITGLSRVKLRFLGPAIPLKGAAGRADVDDAPMAVPVASVTPPDEESLYRVQIGAFKIWDNATRAQATLEGAQLEPGDQVFIVYLGPVKGFVAAEYQRQRAIAAGFSDAIIRKAPFIGQ